jgi:DNA gyrase inhibitor GyrI
MRFIDEPGSKPARKIRSEACLEIRGKAKSEGKVIVKTFPSHLVASVTFDPEKVSPRLVYCGLYGWLRYAGKFEATDSPAREVYLGNPWTNARAWANADIQVPVRKK